MTKKTRTVRPYAPRLRAADLTSEVVPTADVAVVRDTKYSGIMSKILTIKDGESVKVTFPIGRRVAVTMSLYQRFHRLGISRKFTINRLDETTIAVSLRKKQR